MIEQLEEQFTKYEVARILGARALQIAMDAPLLLKIGEKELEDINYNPIEIAKREILAGVLPITVHRPMPQRKESKIRKLTKDQIEEIKKKEQLEREEKEAKEVKGEVQEAPKDEESEETESVQKKEEVQDSEIMELVNPEDEAEDSGSNLEEEGI